MSNRLGVYTDDVYPLVEDDSGARISSDRSFLLFAHHVGQHFDEFVVFGRGAESDEDADYVLPPGVRLVSLPHYENLRRLLEVGRSGVRTGKATAVGGVPTALDHGSAGLLVPPGDAVALADAIENLIDDPEVRRQLVAHGLDLVRELTLEAEGDRVATFLGGAD